MRMISIRRVFVYLLGVGFVLLLCDLTGVHRHILEKDYNTEFTYPLDVPDFPLLVQKYKKGEAISQQPINDVASNLSFLSKAPEGCATSALRLIILVKSAPRSFEMREAIRSTWGNPKRFSDVDLKTVFLLGIDKGLDNSLEHEGQDKADITSLNESIEKESRQYGDIVQGDFHDSDDNTTAKTLMGLKWLVETCPNFRFAIVVNQGMYLSVKNILKFVRHPSEYPHYWEKQKELDQKRLLKASMLRPPRAVRTNDDGLLNNLASDNDKGKDKVKGLSKEKVPDHKTQIKVWKNSPIDFDIDMAEDVKLYAGHVRSGATHRHKLGTKYFLPVEEYPFDYMPPYVSTEAILISKPAVIDLYYASFFTKITKHLLGLDDVFLGICAKKMSMYPFHSEHFQVDPHLVHDPYGKDNTYVLTSDNFNEPERLQKFWNIQKSKGNA